MARTIGTAFLAVLIVLSAAAVSQALIIGPPPPPPPSVTSVPVGNFGVSVAPVGIHVDTQGRIYVTDTFGGSVGVFSNNGVLLDTLKSVGKPLGIAGLNGHIFVGDEASGSVAILDENGSVLGKLGQGDGEFGLPNDIAASQAGTVFVTDSADALVRSYGQSGSPIGSFGSGYLAFPTGVTVDDTAGEVYVVDDTSKKIFIFDLSGLYKRQISLGSNVLRPQGIALRSGKIFVADTYNSSIAVFDKSTGAFVSRIGRYGGEVGEYRIPLDIGFDGNGKLFSANYNNSRVEIVGIDSYTTLTVTPSSLDFTVQVENSVLTEIVTVSSNQAGTPWTAAVCDGCSWLSISAASGTTPSILSVEVNSAGLANGIYKGFVTLATSNGVESAVEVNVVVDVQKALQVTPLAMDFLFQVNAEALPAGKQIFISNSAGFSTFAWQAFASAIPSQWVTVDPPSGNTDAFATVGLTEAARSLNPGTYAGHVTVDAGTVEGSPQSVDVSLKVVYAGTVIITTNLEEATFTLKGPVTYTGSGTYWRNDEVVPGKYKIDFGNIANYMKPSPRQIEVVSGQTVAVEGIYQDKRVLKIGAVSAAVDHANILQVPDGSIDYIVPLFSANGGGLVASDSAFGDIDGDGLDEIAFSSDALNRVEVFTRDGVLVQSIDLAPSPIVRIGMGDVDGDGRAELLVGTLSAGSRTVSAYGYGPTSSWNMKGVLATIAGEVDFRISMGDTDGDRKSELIVSDSGQVAAYDIAGGIASPAPLWSIANPYFGVSEVSSGDINGDGFAEVLVGAGADERNGTFIKVLRNDGSDAGLVIDAFGDLGFTHGVSVAVGDSDGDGVSEIFAGAGPSAANPSLVRVFSGNGSFTGVSIDALGTASNGVRICVGKF